MADFGTDPIKSQSDLMRFETEMSLEARLPEQSILDVFINSAARLPDAHGDDNAHDRRPR